MVIVKESPLARCTRRRVREKSHTKTSEQAKSPESQQVTIPPEAPDAEMYLHLSKSGPAKELRKEREIVFTFDS